MASEHGQKSDCIHLQRVTETWLLQPDNLVRGGRGGGDLVDTQSAREGGQLASHSSSPPSTRLPCTCPVSTNLCSPAVHAVRDVEVVLELLAGLEAERDLAQAAPSHPATGFPVEV